MAWAICCAALLASSAALAASSVEPRSIEEVIARLEAREKELGHPLRMGADFADDVEEIINNRKPRDTSEWD